MQHKATPPPPPTDCTPYNELRRYDGAPAWFVAILGGMIIGLAFAGFKLLTALGNRLLATITS